MSNTTILHGFINSSHTSTLFPYYPEGNIPTPWPIVLVSVLLSLILGFIGFKSAITTWNDPRGPTRVQASQNKSWIVRFRENRAAYRLGKSVVYTRPGPNPDESELPDLNDSSVTAITPRLSMQHRIKVMGAFLISSIRAVFALIVSLQVMLSGHGTHSAPSSLLLLLLSIQTFLSNRAMPRIMNLVLVLDSLFVATAFLIASFDHQGGTSFYGQFDITGGNCPMYAPNCLSEYTQWDEVGCGNYTTRAKNPRYSSFFDPYGSTGDLNSGFNVLHIVEVVISVCGTIWLISIPITIYAARHLFTDSLSDLWRPVELQHKRGYFVTVLFSFFGVLDSFGPVVPVNFSQNGQGHFLPDFGGNSTSWSDCFIITTPTSANGFWDLWLQQNLYLAFRIAVGL